MLFPKWNDHPETQANKLNANYYLHVERSTNAQNIYASRNKILLGHKSEVLKENANHYPTTLQSKGTKPKVHITEYKLSHVIKNKQSIKHRQLLLNINTPSIIIVPLSSSSLPFCHGIASPHFLLASSVKVQYV